MVCRKRELTVTDFARKNLVRKVVLQDAETYRPCVRINTPTFEELLDIQRLLTTKGHGIPADHSGRQETCQQAP